MEQPSGPILRWKVHALTLVARGQWVAVISGQAAAVCPVALGQALCVLAAHQEQAGLLAAALVAHLVVAAFVMQGTFCQGLDYVWEERERGTCGDFMLDVLGPVT